MEEKATIIESIVGKAQEYTKSSIDILKLKAIDKSSNVLSKIISSLIIIIVVLSIITLVNIGAALWIGELIGSSFLGFFIVAAFYTFIAIILLAFKKSILKKPLKNSLITHIREEINI